MFVSILNLHFRCRIHVQIYYFDGCYHKFDKLWEKTYMSEHYMAFVNSKQGAGVVVCVPPPDKVRYLGLKVLSSSKIEVTGVLDGGWYGDIEMKSKSVFDVLVEALEMHDLQHPDHKESYVKFVWGNTTVLEEHWRREMACHVGVKAEEKDNSRSTAKAKAKGTPKSKAAPQQKGAGNAKSKPKAKVVMKKPSKRS